MNNNINIGARIIYNNLSWVFPGLTESLKKMFRWNTHNIKKKRYILGRNLPFSTIINRLKIRAIRLKGRSTLTPCFSNKMRVPLSTLTCKQQTPKNTRIYNSLISTNASNKQHFFWDLRSWLAQLRFEIKIEKKLINITNFNFHHCHRTNSNNTFNGYEISYYIL